jgi:hypothetical protein
VAGKLTVHVATPGVPVPAISHVDEGENGTDGFELNATVPVGVVGDELVSVTAAVQLSTSESWAHESPVDVGLDTESEKSPELPECSWSPP